MQLALAAILCGLELDWIRTATVCTAWNTGNSAKNLNHACFMLKCVYGRPE